MPLRHLILPAVSLVWLARAPFLRSAEPAAPPPNPAAIALGKILSSPTSTDAERLEACDKLKAMGKDAVSAAPALIEGFRRPAPIPEHATDALTAIGPGAIPAMRAAMKLEERETFGACGYAWAAIDVNDGISHKILFHRLETAETIDRYEAALVIAISPLPKDVNATIDALTQSRFYDPSVVVRDAADVAYEALRDRQAGRKPSLPAANSLVIAPEVQWDRDYRKGLVKQAEAGDNRDRIGMLHKVALYGSSAHDVAGAVRKYLDDPDTDVSRAAYDTLHAMGDTAIPQWLDALASHNPGTRRLAMKALSDPWLNKFARRDVLVERLEAMLKEPNAEAYSPATALCTLWPDSEPALTRAMKAGESAVKLTVVKRLLDTGGDLTFHGLEDSKPNAQWLVATPPIAEDFAEFEALVTPDLLLALASDDLSLRTRAFEAMRQLRSSKSRSALMRPLLTQLTGDKPSLSRAAAGDLARLGAEAVPALISGMQSKDFFTRVTCARGLTEHVEPSNEGKLAAALTTALGDPAEEVRRVALPWVENLPQPPPGAVKQLTAWMFAGKEFAGDPINPEEQAHAVTILGQWAVEPKICVPAILRGLENNEQKKVQLATIQALRKFGVEAGAAVPQIGRFLDQDKAALAQAATETLMVLGPDGRRSAVEFLIRVLKSRADESWSPWAIKNLAVIGPDAVSAVPALAALLTMGDNALRTQVALALGDIGPEARSAIPALTRMADNRDPDVRQAASESLLKISPDGKGLGPALIAAVMNRDRVCADRLAAVMQRSGEAKVMRVRLTDLANSDPDMRVRETARRAVEFLGDSP